MKLGVNESLDQVLPHPKTRASQQWWGRMCWLGAKGLDVRCLGVVHDEVCKSHRATRLDACEDRVERGRTTVVGSTYVR